MNTQLPKWPAMVVKGDKVTREQALEICLRTSSLPLSSNTRDVDKEIHKMIFGFPYDLFSATNEEHTRVSKVLREELGYITLGYLQNDRLTSSYIFGPKGWCDWEGNIGCNDYNIGKWPSVKSVLSDWANVAYNFPFLNLTCQLFDKEYSENGEIPLVQFNVSKGEAEVSEVTESLSIAQYTKEQESERIMKRFTDPFAEVGVNFEVLQEAIILVKNKFKGV